MAEVTTVKLSSKGQITIPKSLREKIGLHKGDRVVLVRKDGDIILRKLSLEDIRQEALKNYESDDVLTHEEIFEGLL